ncbi:hypothetical protein FVEN_g12629 [Fusarium venenatum]|nr:hypothetical protein FVEN_g12629 [Fusarium venenatum]
MISFTTTVPTQSCGLLLSQASETQQDFIARAEFCANLLSLQAKSFAEVGTNVFIHPSQTLASNVLRDAFAMSALHAVRNHSNVRFVNAEIAHRASQLIQTMQSGSLSSGSVEMDILAPLQALLVYQCIGLFTQGSISQQTQAERDNIVLQSWALRLQISQPPHNNHAAGNTTWELWVKQESIRRTLICVELVTGTYTYLRGLWPAGIRCHHDLWFTAQRRLWEAQSDVEWRIVRDNTSVFSLPANILRLDKDLENASPSDLDDIGILLHVAGKGLKNLNEWLGQDRQRLRRWGNMHL